MSKPRILNKIDNKINTSEKGAASGVAALDASGKLPNSQLQPENVLPSQSEQSGKFLSTNGSTTNWASVDFTPYRTAANQDIIDNTLLPKSWVTDNVSSTSASNALSANQGKLLNDRIDNLAQIGRYLALWDCTTGKPTTNPTTMPYTYKAGDYYRVSAVSESSEQVNYKPEGSSYNDVASTTQETEDVQIGDVYFYDGTSWSLQINHIGGLVTDVQVDGVSVVTGSTANIVGKATIIESISQPTSIKTDEWWYDIVGTFNITNTLTHCTGASGNPTSIEEGGTTMLVYTADSGYILPDTITITGASYNWTQATGTLVLSNPTGNVSVTITAADQLPIPLCFTANTAGSTITLGKSGSPAWTGSYSTDGTTWDTYTPGTTGAITLANIGDKVYFKGDITANFDYSNYLQFSMTGSVAAHGNCNSMYISSGFENLTTLTYTYCYFNLFKDCTPLTTPPLLPATTLSNICYTSMFEGCTSLTTAPVLPATTLAMTCYGGMFYGCTSLTATPELPATTLARNCYSNMFTNCTSLTTASNLIADATVDGCYAYMFEYCTSLTTAPSIAATHDYNNMQYIGSCESMFAHCTSLTSIPELFIENPNYDIYNKMFYQCSSLIIKYQISSTEAHYELGTHANYGYGSVTFTDTFTGTIGGRTNFTLVDEESYEQSGEFYYTQNPLV